MNVVGLSVVKHEVEGTDKSEIR